MAFCIREVAAPVPSVHAGALARALMPSGGQQGQRPGPFPCRRRRLCAVSHKRYLRRVGVRLLSHDGVWDGCSLARRRRRCTCSTRAAEAATVSQRNGTVPVQWCWAGAGRRLHGAWIHQRLHLCHAPHVGPSIRTTAFRAWLDWSHKSVWMWPHSARVQQQLQCSLLSY